MPKKLYQFVNGKLIRDVWGKTSVDIYQYLKVYAKTTYDNILHNRSDLDKHLWISMVGFHMFHYQRVNRKVTIWTATVLEVQSFSNPQSRSYQKRICMECLLMSWDARHQMIAAIFVSKYSRLSNIYAHITFDLFNDRSIHHPSVHPIPRVPIN